MRTRSTKRPRSGRTFSTPGSRCSSAASGEISLLNLDRLPHGKAAFGSTLELRESTGDTHTFQLVMPEDANADKGWISTASPIGRALLGKEEGDEVKVPTPTGVREFEILKLTTIHDEAS